MPCNLAVAITKAAIEDEYLRSLLTPEITAAVVGAFLAQNAQYAALSPEVQATADGVTASLGPISLSIVRGTVTMRGGAAQRELAARLATDLAAPLHQAAQALLAAKLRQAMARYGDVEMTQQAVENRGAIQQAYVLRLKL
jgi:hypothetical protein